VVVHGDLFRLEVLHMQTRLLGFRRCKLVLGLYSQMPYVEVVLLANVGSRGLGIDCHYFSEKPLPTKLCEEERIIGDEYGHCRSWRSKCEFAIDEELEEVMPKVPCPISGSRFLWELINREAL